MSSGRVLGIASDVVIRDVGPRDGLQPLEPWSVADRIELINGLVRCGLQRVEAGAFVSPKAVPAMANSDQVFMGLGSRTAGAEMVALVPNLRGAQMALAAKADSLTVTVSASERYSQANVGMSVQESLNTALAIIDLVDLEVDVVISCAFGSPYEGEIPTGEVARLVDACMSGGATGTTLADTTGMATPSLLREVLDAVGIEVGLHLHETRGTGLLNAYVGLELGVRRFDTSLGGLGGSPFAKGAAGNLATESLVYFLEEEGGKTGVDLDELIELGRWVESKLGYRTSSPILRAGRRLEGVERG